MGLTLVGPAASAVESVMRGASDATQSNGCVRVTPKEYADLQSRVGELSATDRSQFDALVPPERRDGASNTLYGNVIGSLIRGDSYEQFLSRLPPGLNTEPTGTCALTS